MKSSVYILLFLFTAFSAYAQDEEKPIKNIIGVDLNFIDANSFYSLLGMNYNARYIRELHRYLDLSTSIGYTVSYFAGNHDDVGAWGEHYLRYEPVVACFTPLKKALKTYQIGAGMVMVKARSYIPEMGMTFQWNYLKKKQQSKFTWGFNMYFDMIFERPHKESKQLYYGGGLGFFIGGRF